jgi:trk system potassium uptake protein TrkA
MVSAIDINPEALTRLGATFKGKKILGDALDRETLNKAGIQNADALASVTNSDNLNATLAIIAKNKFRVPKLAIRVFDPSNAEVYRKLGILTISPTEWAASFIKDVLVHPELHSKLTIGNGDVQVIELPVPHGLVGKPVDFVNIPRQVSTVAITRHGKAIIPYQGIILEENDSLTIAVSTMAMGKVEELLSH